VTDRQIGIRPPVEAGAAGTVRSDIPARIDRLPWSMFHTRMVVALGIAWVLDGLEITVAANVADRLTEPDVLGVSARAAGALASVYLAGQVFGALLFGRLSDRLGRRRLFAVTLGVYFGASAATALTFGTGPGWIAYLYATRFVAGMGIGGEYAAINSAIDELIPARYRGRIDVAVNGTYWGGAFLAAVLQVPLLDGSLDPAVGWRLAFLIGPVLGVGIVLLRRRLPESPRWQLTHGRLAAAEESVARIERAAGVVRLPDPDPAATVEIRPAGDHGYLSLLRVLFLTSPRRTVLGVTLMVTQSFLYNAIFFTYATVLTAFFAVPSGSTSRYYVLFALGNLAGPLLLGPAFDRIGRRPMIAGCYLGSAVLLAADALLFRAGAFDATTQTVAWCVIFFFASAGASSAYLTVSEIFPIEVRAKAIAVFFAIAQSVGALGPLLYGALIDKQHPVPGKLAVGYLLAAVLMAVGGVVELLVGPPAENLPLERIAGDLSMKPGPTA
jgi:MFS family permease